MSGRRIDPNFIIKMQDMMDIIYSLNRIRRNHYDDDFIDEIKKMDSVDRVESMLKILSRKGNRETREHSKHLIRLMRNMDSIKRDVSYMKNTTKKDVEKQNYVSKQNYVGEDENSDFLGKLINFLNSLNDEE